ncbi:hypothetical protein [Corynebacterium aquatimens]|nr:hypothetical protein [Corynebacterium aquatimens]
MGPNGAGKTTLAGRIAGRLTGLTIAIGGRTLKTTPARTSRPTSAA